MESTFRIINLLYFYRQSPKKLKHRLLKLVEKEGVYIKKNLELHSNNNHILFNYLGVVLASEFYSNEERNFFVEKLKNECEKQFNDDGTNFEASTSYHLLALEALAWLKYFDERAYLKVAEDVNVNGALAFLNYIWIEGGIWVVGDNDNSVCIKRNWKAVGSNKDCLRKIQYANIVSILGVLPENKTSYQDFGVASLKSGQGEIFLWNPKAGQNGKSGHNHNDLLSVTLSILKKPVFIDTGVFFYSLRRDKFRSSKNHSGFSILNQEPEEMLGNFKLGNRLIRTMDVGPSSMKALVETEGVYLSRFITSNNEGFYVEDENNSLEGGAEVNLVLDPTVIVSHRSGNTLYLSSTSHEQPILISVSESSEVCISKTFTSPNYGEIKKTTKINIISNERVIRWKMIF